MTTPEDRWFRFEWVQSTQDTARDLIRRGEITDRGIVIAEGQSEGRGRGGKPWESPPGGLWMTRVSPIHLDFSLRGLYPIAAGVAAVDALQRVAGVRAWLKWPNDLLVGESKLGGILCETAGTAILIGLGINVRGVPEMPNADPGAPTPVALMDAMGGAPGGCPGMVEDLGRTFDDRMAQEEAVLMREPTSAIAAWKKRTRMMGRSVSVITGEGTFEATARDLDSTGGLVVELESGQRRILTSAEVSIRF